MIVVILWSVAEELVLRLKTERRWCEDLDTQIDQWFHKWSREADSVRRLTEELQAAKESAEQSSVALQDSQNEHQRLKAKAERTRDYLMEIEQKVLDALGA